MAVVAAMVEFEEELRETTHRRGGHRFQMFTRLAVSLSLEDKDDIGGYGRGGGGGCGGGIRRGGAADHP